MHEQPINRRLAPADLDGLKSETSVSSLASNVLVITLADGARVKFYGSRDDTRFAEHFVLRDDDGSAFAFRPGTPESVVGQFRTAVAGGFVNLQTHGW